MFIDFHVLYFALYLFVFAENELSIDGKKQELKKEENNNTERNKMQIKEREKRIGLVVLVKPISCIRHTHRD